MANPVLVEVSRGALVEARHRGAVAVVDVAGAAVLSLGDVGRPVFPRSAVKALQALRLLETGVADALNLSDAELALACASHSGEPAHVAAAAAMLRKAGRDEACLECGPHWPLGEEAARLLAAAGKRPGALHNNCSGKHAGFLCLACELRAGAGRLHPPRPSGAAGRSGDAGGGDGGRPPGRPCRHRRLLDPDLRRPAHGTRPRLRPVRMRRGPLPGSRRRGATAPPGGRWRIRPWWRARVASTPR